MAFSTSGYRLRRVCIGSGLRALRNLMNHGQLQHGDSLPFRELGYEYIASIWKFDRIMVTMRNILVYRAEFPYSEITCARPNPSVVVFDITGETRVRFPEAYRPLRRAHFRMRNRESKSRGTSW
jgi:hypothetical protein